MATKRSKQKSSTRIFFADIAVDALEPGKTLPAKFNRMLRKLDLKSRVEGKSVAIKMHLGGDIGYTTIPPLFVRMLVEALYSARARSVKVMDGNAQNGPPRGYTQEVLGCPVVSCFGETGKYYYKEKIAFKKLDYALFSGEALDTDFFIDLAHVKGHGDCGFGGALKNIGMGIVPGETRQKIHSLEGGVVYDGEKCTYCLKCTDVCPNNAINRHDKEKRLEIFFHHCTYCQHCVTVCPSGAIRMENRKFQDFSKGMAKITAAFLKKFNPKNILFINILLNITIFCDCWGMSTASLVPDIGILASDDIVSIDIASLDLIKEEDLLEKGLPKGRKLLKKGKHLFEKIHGKDPYLMLDYLHELYGGSKKYTIEEVK
ncbi:DUF362 domain-containing protein [Spirochaetota bacterium]